MKVPTSVTHCIHSPVSFKVFPTGPVFVRPSVFKVFFYSADSIARTVSFKVSYATTLVTLLSLGARKSFAFSFVS